VIDMPIKFAWRVDVGSSCVDIRQSPKKDLLVFVVVVVVIIIIIIIIINYYFWHS